LATAGEPDRDVAAQQKGEAAKHGLLAHVSLAGELLADPVGEIFVIGHRSDDTVAAPCTRRAQWARHHEPHDALSRRACRVSSQKADTRVGLFVQRPRARVNSSAPAAE